MIELESLKYEKLYKMRKKKNLTHEQIASALGMSRSTYTHKENGTRGLDINEAKKIAEFYGVSLDELFNS